MAGVQVTLEGLGHVVSNLNGFSAKSSDLSEAFQRIGTNISQDARGLIPVLSGRLAASLRVGKAKSKAVVRAGGARVPYAGVQNYGNYHNIEAKYFMNKALNSNEQRSVVEIEKELSELIRKFQLGN
ncbi:hypothetical protein OHB41_33115 [Streptomyces sp. NBC_01571]|uniref:hypothetical protein n=1 Tax=Streptomyces sp. NBC_01571 TaxID=2975883 RepID=UPI002252A5A0|nr:hypothetical protein [Streptomyces sp. NBC_01571]MCX4577942.1 hypothetical protein [Streptomyces sp. NBC_01571]